MSTQRAFRRLSLWAAAGALVLAAACSSDSPSEPSRDPGPPAGGGGGTSATYNVTVTADPGTIPAGSDDPVIIRVRAVRADNGAAPPNGTAVILSALSGSFGNLAGGNTFTGQLSGGRLEVPYFPAATAEGSVVVTANVAGSVGRVTLLVQEAETLFIGSVSPNVGTPQGGETVTIEGSGFEEPVRVSFGGANAQVLSVSPTRIRVRTPASPNPPDQTVTVPVSVTINVNQEGQASDTLPGGFTFAPGGGEIRTPVILSVSPSTGPNEGGTRVQINGEGFQAPVQVEFGTGGTFLEAQVDSVNANRIIAITPAAIGFGQELQNESVTVRVRNLDTGRTGTLPTAFRYGSDLRITSISPNQAPFTGGDLVTIFGQGFSAPVAVSFGGFAQDVVSVTGTEIVVRTSAITTDSCSDVSGAVQVVNINSGATATVPPVPPVFRYLVSRFAPIIFSVSPTSGPQGGGTDVTINGENLFNPLVQVGGRPAPVLSTMADGTRIVIDTPFLPIDEFDTEACDDNADGTDGERYLPTTVDVRVQNRNTTCDVTFTKAFTYNPSDTSCRNDIGPAPPEEPECNDGIDNDGDGLIDFPEDPGCADASDDTEAPANGPPSPRRRTRRRGAPALDASSSRSVYW
jgi:hypothetical protein